MKNKLSITSIVISIILNVLVFMLSVQDLAVQIKTTAALQGNAEISGWVAMYIVLLMLSIVGLTFSILSIFVFTKKDIRCYKQKSFVVYGMVAVNIAILICLIVEWILGGKLALTNIIFSGVSDMESMTVIANSLAQTLNNQTNYLTVLIVLCVLSIVFAVVNICINNHFYREEVRRVGESNQTTEIEQQKNKTE